MNQYNDVRRLIYCAEDCLNRADGSPELFDYATKQLELANNYIAQAKVKLEELKKNLSEN